MPWVSSGKVHRSMGTRDKPMPVVGKASVLSAVGSLQLPSTDHSFIFLFVWEEGTPRDAQSLLLAFPSEIIPGGIRGTI